MSVHPTYPGVYIQELPSSVRTITGVATSVTAFIGTTMMGPTDKQTLIHSWADFQNIFGGLWEKSNMSYAVSQFYLNGGSDAVIVRVTNGATAAEFPLMKSGGNPVGSLNLSASNPGLWGQNLYVAIDFDVDPTQLALDPSLFNLSATLYDQSQFDSSGNPIKDSHGNPIRVGNIVLSETFRNLSADSSQPRYVVTILKEQSQLLSASFPSAGGFTPVLLFTPSTGIATNVVTLTGKGFKPSTAVTVDYDGAAVATTPGAVNTDAFGFFNCTFAVPAPGTTIPPPHGGAHSISATAGPSSATAALPFWDTSQSAEPSPFDVSNIIVYTAGSASDGTAPVTSTQILGLQSKKTGMYALEDADIFNLLCIAPYDSTLGSSSSDLYTTTYPEAITYCDYKRAMLLVDPPSDWAGSNAGAATANAVSGIDSLLTRSANAAIYFPRITYPDSLAMGKATEYVPCGTIAGVMATTDGSRGVWKAPAGIEATINGAIDLTLGGISVRLTDSENGDLNPLGVNCLRLMPVAGKVVWGSRTLRGADRLADQWKYVPVRRLALFLEESLYRGTQWVVFEPNDEPLWSQIRLNVGSFMQTLFLQGAFQGTTPKDAYFVKCDSETTTATDQNNGIVNIVVGFAPLKPAEFVIIKIQQIARPAQGGG